MALTPAAVALALEAYEAAWSDLVMGRIVTSPLGEHRGLGRPRLLAHRVGASLLSR